MMRFTLFTNDAMKIRRGKNQLLNVINDSIPTLSFICATNATNGTINESKKDTLFGLTTPFITSMI